MRKLRTFEIGIRRIRQVFRDLFGRRFYSLLGTKRFGCRSNFHVSKKSRATVLTTAGVLFDDVTVVDGSFAIEMNVDESAIPTAYSFDGRTR